tara:strand:- start:311 stop:694 length:384 start_codon:yes stop_codon:yes gene_type:complete
MLGYLNVPSPFDTKGWFNTGDIVDEKDGFYKIVGRANEIINVGGLKFMPLEVEQVALSFPGILFAKAYPKNNPITTQHVEMSVQTKQSQQIDKKTLINFFNAKLPKHMVPKRITFEKIDIGHRLKRA